MREIDFQLIQDKVSSKIFKFTNADGSVYDFAGCTVKCELYLTAIATDITCTIDLITGSVTVPFTALNTANMGIFEYKIIQTKLTI